MTRRRTQRLPVNVVIPGMGSLRRCHRSSILSGSLLATSWLLYGAKAGAESATLHPPLATTRDPADSEGETHATPCWASSRPSGPISSKRRAWRRSAEFLANPEYGGNTGKAGWRAIGFDDRFVWAEPFGWYDGEGASGE